MKCPRCNTLNLNLMERQGVELDYCPECRGIWLDRGELEKIIEKSYTASASPVYSEHQGHHGENRQQYHENRDHDDHDYGRDGRHRKKSWLSELFD
ncbi:MAG: zf-TFIIB domain-containing protein [Lentisphaerae bacterium]|nr:zf-TFIIB domain-containing protein [Lentisphaerota bacterium]